MITIPGLLLLILIAGMLRVTADEVLEAARELLESGRILPLETILAEIAESVPGKLIETQLEYEDGRILYDLKILRPEGRVQEVEVDAATGEIIKIEDDD